MTPPCLRGCLSAEGSRPLPTKQTMKGVAMANLRAGHARPLQVTVCSAAFPPSRHLHSCLSHAQRTSAASRRRTPSRLPRPRCRTCHSRRSRCGRNCHSWTRPRNPVRRWLSAPRRLVGGHAVSRPLHAQFIGAAHRKNDTVRRKAAVGRGRHFVQLRIVAAAHSQVSFSHLPSAWRLTPIFSASASWLSPCALRAFWIFYPSVIRSPSFLFFLT